MEPGPTSDSGAGTVSADGVTSRYYRHSVTSGVTFHPLGPTSTPHSLRCHGFVSDPRQGHYIGVCRNMGGTPRAPYNNPCENNYLPPLLWHFRCIAIGYEAEDSDTTGARRRRFRPGSGAPQADPARRGPTGAKAESAGDPGQS